MREVFHIDPNDLAIGMVARFQKYRRTDVFLNALSKLVGEFPHLAVRYGVTGVPILVSPNGETG